MGNTSSSAVQKCLESALGSKDLVAFKNAPFFQITDVKPYNLGIPVTPAAVTYPKTTEHISAIVKCAVDNNLKVQPRCGGHSYANYGIGGQDNTIVVDMKNFQQFSMDESTWQATIGGGTLLKDVTKRLHENGKRAMAHGTCPQVGIGGHATIGGLGPSSRLWGSALDHVEEVEVVLANSTVVRANEKENKDILFAVKGAAAGFGIVTEFKVRTQAEPDKTVLYSYNFHGGDTKSKADALKQWQKLISDPELSRKFASQFILTQPLGAIVTGTFFGSQQEFDSLNITARLPNSSKKDAIEIKDWLGVVGHWAEDIALELVGGVQSNFYAKSLAYTEKDILPDDAVDKLFEYIDKADKGGAVWFVIWDLEGGAINDVAPDATAYGHRNALFYHQAYAVNLLGKVNEKTRNFLTGINKAITDALPNHEQGAYAGYVDPALGENSASLYWGGNVERLQNIKAAIDPQDIFSNPQSIRPAKKSAKMV
ncbi:Glucooligosaccharide oxidase [Cucurbitaria berberidis CBS 394.84]|uniref:Glucooligosaccharide oxidase n=1 Tax=Cucurbitaria berberidis CBS 394.84 TaxID=1168544 RepID=A0A9P4L3N0_9PLEO|nr:Glucooligosaccharide oxidase [Cucurbitaria berberidis CBS 394.84]KAF1841116.1 Glucooligosaccharide oxidase [Cucurbitaria berberidis CBS 394.84]